MIIKPKLMLFKAEENPRLFNKFYAAWKKCFNETPQNFFKIAYEELKSGLISVVINSDTDEIVSGCRGVVDGNGDLIVSQCFTLSQAKGKGFLPTAVASLRLFAYFNSRYGNNGLVFTAKLFNRVHNGKANQSALRAYKKVGFEPGEVIDLQVGTNEMDRHLLETADDQGKIQTQVMFAKQSSLIACSNLIKKLRSAT